MLQWKAKRNSKSAGLMTSAYCVSHDKMCLLPTADPGPHRFRVEGAGCSCVPFSYAGKRLKARSLFGSACEQSSMLVFICKLSNTPCRKMMQPFNRTLCGIR